MVDRDCPFSNSIRVKGNNIGGLPVITRMFELIPCEDGKKTTNFISYTRVKEDLNIKTLNEILKAKLPMKWKTEDINGYLTYQYDDKPKVYISKENGRLYCPENNRFSQWQAFKLLRVLVKFGQIIGYMRHQKRKFYAPYKGYQYIKPYD